VHRFPAAPPALALALTVAFASTPALADDFEPGTLVVPMDIDYQDAGMLRAYGLVYELLRNGIPVRWVIRTGKGFGEADFTTSATDFATNAVVMDHGYRGGPWVVDASDSAEATPIVEAWQMTYPETTVHVVTEAFEGEVARYLVVAPTIGMHADGNEDIAREYLIAAGIPDSTLDLDWPNTSPDMIEPEELAGPSDVDHADGALFDEDGDPVYCQFMSMHWGVANAEAIPEAVAEVREFLNHPTHFFAECQAVSAFENLDPYGFFLTPNGLLFADQPDAVDFYNSDSPFAQLDGEFQTVGGSEPAYSLPPGDAYKAGGVVMMTAAGMPEGTQDLWMTGYLDGACPPDALECGSLGKVSYLGGHRYMTDAPMTTNPDSQGARLFLNSLFEAPCATLIGLPIVNLAADAPELVVVPEATFEIAYANAGEVTALAARLVEPLPAGTTFVSATNGGVAMGTDVVWELGNLGPGEGGDVGVTVQLAEPGLYANSVRLEYRIGLNDFVLDSNETQTVYDPDGVVDSSGTGGGSSGDASGSDGSTSGGTATGSGTATADSSAGGDGSEGSGGSGTGETESSGCGCTSGSGPLGWGGWWLGLAFVRRRRLLAAFALTACGGGSESTSDDEGTTTSGIGIETLTAADDDEGTKLDIVGKQDLFATSGCQKIDFLFVIDSSESMTVHQTNLVNSFPGFVTAMQDAVTADDWHVMVVDTDAQWGGSACANACTTLGTCPGAPEFDCATPPPELCDIVIGGGIVAPYGRESSNTTCDVGGDARYIDSGTADLLDSFSCIAKVGIDGNSEERTAEAIVAAVDPAASAADGCNEGFLRDDAILVVTVITDEADVDSVGDPQAWHDAIVAAKHDDPAAVVMLGLLPDADLDPALCEDDDVGGVVAELVATFPAGQRASVCEPDYGGFLADAVAVIADTCAQFVPPG